MQFSTPVGVFVHPHLNRKDTKFGKGKFKLNVEVPADKGKELREAIKAFAIEEFGPKKAKEAFDKTATNSHVPLLDNDEDGTITFRAASQYGVPVFDAKGNLIPASQLPNIGAGSRGRMKIKLGTWGDKKTVKFGVNAFLQSVQLISLVEYMKGAFDPLEAEDEEFSEDEQAFVLGEVEYSAGGLEDDEDRNDGGFSPMDEQDEEDDFATGDDDSDF